jgi:hypothetical protein
MQLKKGTRVLLRQGTRYKPCPSNPTEGSKYECIGIIERIGLNHYSVRWDNGTTNGYVEGDLRPDGPYIDIWPEV